MTADEFNKTILAPGVSWCRALPKWPIPFQDDARVLLLAIAGQESDWAWRVQSGNGPAHGFFQMEKHGGVLGVLTSHATHEMAAAACAKENVQTADAVWRLMATEAGDMLSVAFARLLLWSDPSPLPATSEDGWSTYLRVWRPGKPRPDDWADNYQAALSAIKGDKSDN